MMKVGSSSGWKPISLRDRDHRRDVDDLVGEGPADRTEQQLNDVRRDRHQIC